VVADRCGADETSVSARHVCVLSSTRVSEEKRDGAVIGTTSGDQSDGEPARSREGTQRVERRDGAARGGAAALGLAGEASEDRDRQRQLPIRMESPAKQRRLLRNKGHCAV